MSFQRAVAQLLAHEGGFVNHPADKGGATNWGITQATYERWKGRKVTVEEIRNMPVSDAHAIYKANYWDKFSGDQIRQYTMAYAIFDQAVNSGVSTAVARAQKIIGVPADGVMGSKTLAALNAFAEPQFISGYLAATKANYQNIVAKNPTQEVFLKGWLNRVASLESYSLKNLGVSNEALISAGLVITVAVIALLITAPRAKGIA